MHMSQFVDDHSPVSVDPQGHNTDYDFKGGAGSISVVNNQNDHKKEITYAEEHSPDAQLEHNVSDDGNKDLIEVTPVRQSARTAGKRFKYWPCHYIALNIFCHNAIDICD